MESDYVGIHEIAQMAGITKQAVVNWRARFPDFPSPIAELKSGPVFSRELVQMWLRKRRVQMATTQDATMASAPIYEKAKKILEGHRRGHYDLQGAVNLLEVLWRQQSEDGRKDMENALWTTLSSEPLAASQHFAHTPMIADVLKVVIRAIATFAPTAQLPSLVFGRLPWQKTDLMGLWAQSMCNELSYSMIHHADRFTQATLGLTKAFCATYTFAQSAQLIGTEFPKVVIEAAADLERSIEHIEYSRFAETLQKSQPPQKIEADELHSLLGAAGLSHQIASAMETAEAYLEGAGAFDAKHAAGLIRTCIDETNRGMVAELQKMTGLKCADPDKDGSRRTYLLQVEFINVAEEQFLTSIYTLLSKEGVHKLLAPKETILLINRTVKGYLLLLLRRLSDRRSWTPMSLTTAPS